MRNLPIIAVCSLLVVTSPSSKANLLSVTQKINTSTGISYNVTTLNPTGYVSVERSDFDFNATAGGSAEYGVLKAEASASYLTDPINQGGEVSSFSAALDTVKISNSALTGKYGTMDVEVDYDWALSLSRTGLIGSAFTQAHVQLSFGGFVGVDVFETKMDKDPFDTWLVKPLNVDVLSSIENKEVKVRVPFVFGQAFPLDLFLEARAHFEPFRDEVSFSETADAAHTVYFGGISDITDSSGASVIAEITSESGTDYSKSFAPSLPASSVPEPSTLILFGIGIAGVAIRRFRICTRPAEV